MTLQKLVNHFNERFAHEHRSNLQPFILKNGQVSGIFGPIHIGSKFLAIRPANAVESLVGHAAQIFVSPHDQVFERTQSLDLDNGPVGDITQNGDYQYIINLDRLSRTVHMLNYLQYLHHGGVLFLDVDPRHIYGVQQNHGVYFSDVITKCGLATKQVVISMQVDYFHALHHTQLLAGLNSYRQHGYKVALTVGNLDEDNGLKKLIVKLSPDYLRISAPGAELEKDAGSSNWGQALKSLLAFQELHGGQTVMQQVEHEEHAAIAEAAGFNLVQGHYYDKLATDHLRCL
jgi:EAL domain-containing protein (putative c-di-GMP-specific phosphodiesterase class I)